MGIKIGYTNHLEAGTITVTDEATGYPKARLCDRQLRRMWKSSSAGSKLVSVDMGAGVTVSPDTLCIPAGHNLSGQMVYLSGSDDGAVWTIYNGWAPEDATLQFRDIRMATGAQLLTNPTFEAGTTGWSAGNSAVLSSVAGGSVGNCLQVLEAGVATPYAYQQVTVTPGAWYVLSVGLKKGDQICSGIVFNTNGTSGALWKTFGYRYLTSWGSYIVAFQVPANATQIEVRLWVLAAAGSGLKAYFDECELHAAVAVTARRYWGIYIEDQQARASEIGEIFLTNLVEFSSVQPSGVRTPRKFNAARSESLGGVAGYLRRGSVRNGIDFSLPYMTAADYAVLDAWLTAWDGCKPFLFVDWDGVTRFCEIQGDPVIDHHPGLLKSAALSLLEVL